MTRRAELRNYQRELHYFQIRLGIASVFVLVMFGLLLLRFFYLQVIQHDYYVTQAENNRISLVPIIPNRGLILDRNGVVLAHNFSAYTLEITPSKAGELDEVIGEIAKIVEITPKDRRRFKKLLEESHSFESIPIRTRLTDEEVAQFAVNSYRFPGVEIKARLFRHYPMGDMASHVVGYISRITEEDLTRIEADGLSANYQGTDHIGKTGLEQSYEKVLHGTTGFEQVEVDANGHAIRTLQHSPPVPGDDLVLSMDAKLQEVAERAFGNYRGALVAIDPNTGGVLAFVSKPGFDTNLFVDGIDPQNWDALNNSPDHPMNNRALQGQYPPGSTFKPFMALAGLELNKRKPDYSIRDPGYYFLPGSGHRYRDWKTGGHGTVDIRRAITVSCDTFFYGLANDLGIDSIHDFIGQFGLGKKTGIDLEGEVSGLLPSVEWKQKRYGQKWYAGDTISVGIGQGYNLTTPLQLAHAVATLANDGKAMRPRLVREIRDARNGTVRALEPESLYTVRLKPENIGLVKAAMVDVVRPGGTAAASGYGAPYAFAGKTGTAQVIAMKQNEKYDERRVQERHRDHALFIAYAPAEKPAIAVAVLVENGGHGGSAAAPVARQVFDYYLLGKVPAKPALAKADDGEESEDD